MGNLCGILKFYDISAKLKRTPYGVLFLTVTLSVLCYPALHKGFIFVRFSQSITLTVPFAVKFSGVTVVSPFSTVTG